MSSQTVTETGRTGVPMMSPAEKELTSKWFVAAMCLSLVAGIIIASIPASPAVAHAIGTTIPWSVGGSLVGVALIGLTIHARTQARIQFRTGLMAEVLTGDPNAPQLTKREVEQRVHAAIMEFDAALQDD